MLAAFVVLLLVSLWVYRGVLENGFVWDTVFYLEVHEQRLADLGIENLVWMMTSTEAFYWHPVTWFSWAADYHLYGGLDSRGFHLTNALIHGLNSGMLFLLLLMLLNFNVRAPESLVVAGAARGVPAAFVAAMIFALHPQHVESVAWVAERKDLLCQFFLVLALMSYLRTHQHSQAKRSSLAGLTLLYFLLALMSKPMAVTFPLLLLLLDVYPLGRSRFWRPGQGHPGAQTLVSLALEKWPYFLAALLISVVTISASQGALTQVPLSIKLLNACNSVIAYISKFLFPFSFSPHYPYFTTPAEGIRLAHFVPVLGILAITAAAALAWTKGQRGWLIGWLFYLAALLPVLGLISAGTQGMADRFAYFPTLPLYIAVAFGLQKVRDDFAPAGQLLILVLVAGACLLLALKTISQVRVWKNEFTLFQSIIERYPDNPTARDNMGILLFRAGEFDAAIRQFNVIEQLPVDPTSMRSWRAVAHMETGNHELALRDLEWLEQNAAAHPRLRLDEDCLAYDLGWVHVQLGNLEQAVSAFSSVSAQSGLVDFARQWLARIKGVGEMPGESAEDANTPGFCRVLFPQNWR